MSSELLLDTTEILLDTGHQESSGLAPGDLPDYTVTWEPSGINYIIGEVRPLKCAVVENSGDYVDLPSSGSITVTLPDLSTTALTPLLEATGAALTQVMGALFTFTQAGTHKVLFTMTIGIEVLEFEQDVYCNAYP